MTRFRMLVVTALAVLGVLGVTAGQAFAVERSGEFVGEKGANLKGTKFEGKATTASILESVKGVKVTCKNATGKGEILGTGAEGAAFAEGEAKFKECKNSLGQKCKTEKAEGEEEIIIKGIKNYIWAEKQTAAKKLEGLLVKSEINGEFEFKCSTVNQKVKGSFLIPVTKEQEGALKNEYKGTASQAKGIQKPTEGFDPKTKAIVKEVTLSANLANEGFAQAGQEGTAVGTLLPSPATKGEFR